MNHRLLNEDFSNNQLQRHEALGCDSFSNKTPTNNKLLNDFCMLYQSLNKDNLTRLREVYSENIMFTDPMHQVNGIDNLIRYFEKLYQNMQHCDFHILHIIENKEHASIIWRMEYSHQKIKQGKVIIVDGSSHLQFSEKIDYHRDYLDIGQMLYEQLPLLGSVIKTIKKRASQ